MKTRIAGGASLQGKLEGGLNPKTQKYIRLIGKPPHRPLSDIAQVLIYQINSKGVVKYGINIYT
jgi:hypothetical protein